ncbi:bacteriophage T4 gp5 trimerisation domain-containing protein [Burkholderia arboris]|nr:hypothetical protein [Burkholderia arboris]
MNDDARCITIRVCMLCFLQIGAVEAAEPNCVHEQVTSGQDRRHDIGQDDFLSVGRNHTIHTGKDRTEEVGNHRRDKTAADHTVDIGGRLTQRVQGRAELEAGQAIRQRTKVVELHAGEVIRLRGPGGTITLDDGGVTLDAVVIRLKGPLIR